MVLSFDEWLALDWQEQSKMVRLGHFSVETLDAFVQECEKRARAMPVGEAQSSLWSHRDYLKSQWFIEKHPECVKIHPDKVELLPSKVVGSIETLEDYVSLHSAIDRFHLGLVENADLKLAVMKHSKHVRKLPDGRLEFLMLWDKRGESVNSFDDAYEGWGQVYEPDLEGNWVMECYYPSILLEKHRRQKSTHEPEAIQSVAVGVSTSSTRAALTESNASRAAEFALASSVGEARYDTNEALQTAWQRHMLSQNIHCAPEEARQRFLDAYAAFKTQRIRMLNAADAAFFQTYATVYRV